MTRGWRRERRVDRLILSKFIEPPSDGDDISDCTSLCNVREGNNQRGFEVSRARRRFLHLESKFTPVDEWSGGVARDVSAG